VTRRIGPASVVGRRPGIHVVPIDREAVLLDEQNQKLHRLNETAHLVLDQLTGADSLGEIARRLAAATGASTRQVTADVMTLVQQLIEEGVVELVADESASS
jgi:hypothetical protein